MSSRKAANRYAIALFEVAKENKVLDKVLKDIEFMKATIDGSKELVLFLKSPIIKKDKKQAVLKELFESPTSDLTFSFISIIVRKDRESLLPLVTDAFIDVYNEAMGIIEIDVKTAEKLSDKETMSLKKALEVKTGKTVNLNITQDENLMGGMTVQINDTIIDGSVRHKLSELETLFYNHAI